MSRIEKALEKAVEMRESMRDAIAEETITDHKLASAEFEVGEAVVNPDLVDRHLVCLTDPHSSVGEQYKKLRARILKATSKDFLNTIMVTSPDIGEGKTITALNLAVTMANEFDYTVLLVDADLKHPTIPSYLGIEAKYGLSDYLMNKAKLQDILIKTGIGKLVVLPAGNPLENAAELLASERMRSLVQELKRRYKDRYIIFDSSPILITADSLSLSRYMDGIVFVIQAYRTTPKIVSHAISLIKGSNILGIVFNNVPEYLAKNLYPYGKYHNNGGSSKSIEGSPSPTPPVQGGA
jgi:protein-tyrosine kinase